MYKSIRKKTSRQFLKKELPDNFLPAAKLISKDKRILREKRSFIARTKRRIGKIQKLLREMVVQDTSVSLSLYETSTIPYTYNTVSSFLAKKLKLSVKEKIKDNFLSQSDKRVRENSIMRIKGTSSQSEGTNLLLRRESLNKKIQQIPSTFQSTQKINNRRKQEKKRMQFLYPFEQLTEGLLSNRNPDRNASDFFLKLRERKKFSLFYGGISKKFYQKVFFQAVQKRGSTEQYLLIQFEKRLDVVLYRICFATSIAQARQLITHGFILVNGVSVTIPSYQVQAGDVISVKREKKQEMGKKIIAFLKKKVFFQSLRFFFSWQNSKLSGLPKVYKTTQAIQLAISRIFFKRLRTSKFQSWYRKRKFIRQFFNKLQNLSTLSGKIKKQRSNLLLDSRKHHLFQLKAKRLVMRNQSRPVKRASMKVSPLKPIHVEVSHKVLTAIILFVPQKIAFPTFFNLNLLARSVPQM